MKVSLNWVKEFTKVELPIEELVDKIGAQLGAVDGVVNLGERYQGIVIAKVVTCQDHPNADKLHVCMVDDGGAVKDVPRDESGYVQVVCGAPNVREGMLVAWLPPGSTVPSSWDGEKFVLEARELRGVTSNGMLASAKELAIGDSHEGLLEIDIECKPGADFAKLYKLDDYIIDIENKMFTHRPDCFGMLGIAREIAGIQGIKFASPEWYSVFKKDLKPFGPELPLEVKNELPELVPRFAAVAISNVAITHSLVLVQSYLARVGVRPVNNIVDVTNYMMLLTGQPLHAYDYDKVKALSGGTATLVVRNPHPGEKLTLLNGKEVEPRSESILIATDKQAIGLGGVMGGADTEVSNDTKNIILECASFDMYSIRRTSMEHGIFSDAVTRFTKGQSPLQNDRILMESSKTICDLGAGEFASDLIDDMHVNKSDVSRGNLFPPVTLGQQYINERLGLGLSVTDIKSLLENVEFQVTVEGNNLTVTAPFWRTDIELREDVVEEVGRLYGYDHLPLELPKRDLTPAKRDPLLETKAKIRGVLAKAGANEVLTYSFVHGDLLDKVGQNKDDAFRLSNALSPDLQYYRLSLMPSLLASVHPNIKSGYDEFALFEMGKVHTKSASENGLPFEFDNLALVYTTNKSENQGAAYYEARKYLTQLAAAFGVEFEFQPFEVSSGQDVVFEPVRAARVVLRGTTELLGVVGELKAAVRKSLKLPNKTAGFEISTAKLQRSTLPPTYVALPKYPKVTQDISLKVPSKVQYGELEELITTELTKAKPENSQAGIQSLDIYQREDAHKQIAFRVSIASYERTLTDHEVNALLDQVAAAAKSKLGAERL
ncbi:MAG TPA: phenylalanine--tRNA ligase subunit beta [Candidatus Saccharimonadales bacterium]|nr:phenylalanine--tRNA ligase subunit beta [Candidatus Saccharimonadales bacterium]